jgi:hypothetical protein
MKQGSHGEGWILEPPVENLIRPGDEAQNALGGKKRGVFKRKRADSLDFELIPLQTEGRSGRWT